MIAEARWGLWVVNQNLYGLIVPSFETHLLLQKLYQPQLPLRCSGFSGSSITKNGKPSCSAPSNNSSHARDQEDYSTQGPGSAVHPRPVYREAPLPVFRGAACAAHRHRPHLRRCALRGVCLQRKDFAGESSFKRRRAVRRPACFSNRSFAKSPMPRTLKRARSSGGPVSGLNATPLSLTSLVCWRISESRAAAPC